MYIIFMYSVIPPGALPRRDEAAEVAVFPVRGGAYFTLHAPQARFTLHSYYTPVNLFSQYSLTIFRQTR